MLASSAISKAIAGSDDMLEQMKLLIGETLQLGVRSADLEMDTLLLGSLTELDSMAVVTVITALEEHFQFVVDDDDDLSDAFVSMGSLTDYVSVKIRNSQTF